MSCCCTCIMNVTLLTDFQNFFLKKRLNFARFIKIFLGKKRMNWLLLVSCWVIDSSVPQPHPTPSENPGYATSTACIKYSLHVVLCIPICCYIVIVYVSMYWVWKKMWSTYFKLSLQSQLSVLLSVVLGICFDCKAVFFFKPTLCFIGL